MNPSSPHDGVSDVQLLCNVVNLPLQQRGVMDKPREIERCQELQEGLVDWCVVVLLAKL